ncbi:hypothetical protein [Thermococcus gorgonarius]|nr:hypothetical protein [Thermococcus gorgonarius]
MTAAAIWLLLPGMPKSGSPADPQTGLLTTLVQVVDLAAKIALEVSAVGLLIVAITGLVVK